MCTHMNGQMFRLWSWIVVWCDSIWLIRRDRILLNSASLFRYFFPTNVTSVLRTPVAGGPQRSVMYRQTSNTCRLVVYILPALPGSLLGQIFIAAVCSLPNHYMHRKGMFNQSSLVWQKNDIYVLFNHFLSCVTFPPPPFHPLPRKEKEVSWLCTLQSDRPTIDMLLTALNVD